MLRTRRFNAVDEKEIEAAMADLPENSFRQLIPVGKALAGREIYLLIFELTAEQEKTWTPTYVQPAVRQANRYIDY